MVSYIYDIETPNYHLLSHRRTQGGGGGGGPIARNHERGVLVDIVIVV